MIDKLTAIKILELCGDEKLTGAAKCLGDQIPTVSEEWVRQAQQIIAGQSPWDRMRHFQKLRSKNAPLTGKEFFQLAGFESYQDIDYNGKASLMLDWGKPLPQQAIGTADFLYDGGVVEHIPNVHQAMANNIQILRLGGTMIEHVPVNTYGESYYCLDPMLLRDFYGLNGFIMKECFMMSGYDWRIWLVDLYRLLTSEKRQRKWQQENLCLTEQGYSWIQDILNGDNLKRLKIIDPFSPKRDVMVRLFKLPRRTTVMYIGKKVAEVPQSEDPTQGCYPSAFHATMP